MRLAIIGGTFNPVHTGHLFLAEEVRSRMHYERVLFIPANIPVHKKIEVRVTPAQRLEMLRLATGPYPEFMVDDCELRRGGASYAIHTVREILHKYPVEGKLGLIIGDDLAAEFHTWKQASQLAEMVKLIIARRLDPMPANEAEYRSDPSHGNQATELDFPCTYIDNRLFPASSSEIRERIHQGLPIRFLVPDPVLLYIKDHGLYR